MRTTRLQTRPLIRSARLATIGSLGLLGAVGTSQAQIASDDFEVGNPNDWGVEFNVSGTQSATGGNPGGRLEVMVSNATSNLPAAMLVPASLTHPYKGNFRALGAGGFSFDRQVESGSANFGTLPFLVLGNDGGTPNDYNDDAWAFVHTGDNFQFGFVPWATISTPIPSGEFTVPLNWDVAALPNSPLAAFTPDDIWDAIIQDVSYVGISMNRPWGGAGWFGTHVLSLDNFVLDSGGSVGTNYCGPAVANSTGASAQITALGSNFLASNSLSVSATSLPAFSFGFFITSSSQGFVTNPGGSAGNLCLSGNIGRYVGAGQIQSSGSAGRIDLDIDMTSIPTPTGFTSLSIGDIQNFQAWYRDSSPSGPTSNFTDGVMVTIE